MEVDKDEKLQGEISKLVGCLSTQSLVLHSEDLVAYVCVLVSNVFCVSLIMARTFILI